MAKKANRTESRKYYCNCNSNYKLQLRNTQPLNSKTDGHDLHSATSPIHWQLDSSDSRNPYCTTKLSPNCSLPQGLPILGGKMLPPVFWEQNWVQQPFCHCTVMQHSVWMEDLLTFCGADVLMLCDYILVVLLKFEIAFFSGGADFLDSTGLVSWSKGCLACSRCTGQGALDCDLHRAAGLMKMEPIDYYQFQNCSFFLFAFVCFFFLLHL